MKLATIVVFSVIIIASIVLAILSRRGTVGDLGDFMVANRSFGAILVFFLSVGEIYSIGSMIGVPGAVYSKGSSYAIWFLGYILLAYPVGYFIVPAIWRAGKTANAMTLPDLFDWRFDSKGLALLTALVGILFMIPAGQIHFSGLAVIFTYLGIHLNFKLGVIIAACIAFLYVAVAGIRAPAWVSIMKDFLMILAIVIGGVIAYKHAPGGLAGIFQAVMKQKPGHLSIPTQSIGFIISTILFQSVGFYMFPGLVQGIFTAKSEEMVRRNQIIMPIYMLMYPFLIIASFFALISVSGLKKPDEAFMAVISTHVPGWLLGVVAAGGALTGILLLAVLSLTIGSIVSKNILSIFAPAATSRQITQWARSITGLTLIVSVLLTLFWPHLILGLLNIAYFGITQFFPGVLAILTWKRATKWGVGAGLVLGVAGVIALNVINWSPYGINKGLLALCVNVVVMVIVSYLTPYDDRAAQRYDLLKDAANSGTA